MSLNKPKEKDTLKNECPNQLSYSVKVLLGFESNSESFDSTSSDTCLFLLVIRSSSLLLQAVTRKINSNNDVILNHFNQYHLIMICSNIVHIFMY
jgi:hypothetical protein